MTREVPDAWGTGRGGGGSEKREGGHVAKEGGPITVKTVNVGESGVDDTGAALKAA